MSNMAAVLKVTSYALVLEQFPVSVFNESCWVENLLTLSLPN
jgi:hypothetical protein